MYLYLYVGFRDSSRVFHKFVDMGHHSHRLQSADLFAGQLAGAASLGRVTFREATKLRPGSAINASCGILNWQRSIWQVGRDLICLENGKVPWLHWP